MSDTQKFSQAHLKYERAQKHIIDLRTQWDAYLLTDFCRAELDNKCANIQKIRVISNGPLPNEMLLTLGDALHNLRCALDYAINEILEGRNERITFPMDEERANLHDSFRTEATIIEGRTKKKGRNSILEQTAPGIGAFIVDELRPYKAAKGYLWPLNKLDNADKHRLLIPVLVPQTIEITNVRGRNMFVGKMKLTLNAGGYCNLLEVSPGGLTFDSMKPTAKLFFNETEIMENEEIFPALTRMSEAVMHAITRLDAFTSERASLRTGQP